MFLMSVCFIHVNNNWACEQEDNQETIWMVFCNNHLLRNDHGRRRLQSSYVFGNCLIQTLIRIKHVRRKAARKRFLLSF